MSTTSDWAVEAHGLVKTFGENRAVDGVLVAEAVLSPEAGRVTAPMRDPDAVTDLFITFREAVIHLTEMSVQKPTLDEVSLTLTGHAVETDADAASEPERVNSGRPQPSPPAEAGNFTITSASSRRYATPSPWRTAAC